MSSPSRTAPNKAAPNKTAPKKAVPGQTGLRLLPPRSPRRASVVARLEHIERELAAQPAAT